MTQTKNGKTLAVATARFVVQTVLEEDQDCQLAVEHFKMPLTRKVCCAAWGQPPFAKTTR